MEVLKSNFSPMCRLFEQLLPNSVGVAMDLELTGIRGQPEYWGDTPEMRYQKLKASAAKYSIIQVGLALFHQDEGGRLVVHPFTFYLFPEPQNGKKQINMETAAIVFNRDCNLDFNKWIYEGIPYVTEKQEKEIYNKYLGRNQGEKKKLIINRPGEKKVMEEVLESVERFAKAQQATLMEVPNLNSYLRKYLYLEMEDRWPELIVDSVPSQNKENTLMIYKMTDAEKAAFMERKEEELRAKCRDLVGFNTIFGMLATHKKPLIGHSCISDLLFLFNSLVGPLPDTLEEYKLMVSQLFPTIYDTKHLFDSLTGLKSEFETRGEGHNLGNIYKFLESKVPNKIHSIPSEFSRYNNTEHLHEAGYDALITGLSFYYMQLLAGDPSPQRNLIFLYKSFFVLNLGGEDLREPAVYYCILIDQNSQKNVLYDMSLEGKVNVKPNDEQSMILQILDFQVIETILAQITAEGYKFLTYENYVAQASAIDN